MFLSYTYTVTSRKNFFKKDPKNQYPMPIATPWDRIEYHRLSREIENFEFLLEFGPPEIGPFRKVSKEEK